MSNANSPQSQEQAQQSRSPREQKADQETWEGGGREPRHPDDIGAEGEYLGSDQAAPDESEPQAPRKPQ